MINSLSLSLSSVCLSLSVSVSVCLSVSLSLSLCICLSLCLCLSVSLLSHSLIQPTFSLLLWLNRFPLVNYEDPDFNIAMPVFAIHGNHDDPTGVSLHTVQWQSFLPFPSGMKLHATKKPFMIVFLLFSFQDSNISAMDVLDVANLINYFGKVVDVEDITVSPVLLQKG